MVLVSTPTHIFAGGAKVFLRCGKIGTGPYMRGTTPSLQLDSLILTNGSSKMAIFFGKSHNGEEKCFLLLLHLFKSLVATATPRDQQCERKTLPIQIYATTAVLQHRNHGSPAPGKGGYRDRARLVSKSLLPPPSGNAGVTTSLVTRVVAARGSNDEPIIHRISRAEPTRKAN